MTPEQYIFEVDRLVYSDKYLPRRGWHDNHRLADRTPTYLPALMQVREEYYGLIKLLVGAEVTKGNALQLGLGECFASHDALRIMFGQVTTVSWDNCLRGDAVSPALDTHSQEGLAFAMQLTQAYDLLFIDAGHTFEDVKQDHETYGPLVRPGGIIAFHDALQRPGFPEVEVWRYLETLPGVSMIGTEVGIGWVMQS